MSDYNPLEGVGKAELFEKGKYLNPGLYVLAVKKTIFKSTRKSGDAFIVEFEVLESSDEENHAVGSTCTWYQGLRDKEVAFPAIKDFMRNLLGINPDDKAAMQEFADGIDKMLHQAINNPDLFEGTRIRVETYMIKTKAKGLDFTVHKWSLYEGDEE